MLKQASLPPISFTNELSNDEVTVYDSFDDGENASYFGTLTPLGTIKPNKTVEITPIHTCSVFLVKRHKDGFPVLRCTWMLSSASNTSSFSIKPSDLQAMQNSLAFIKQISAHPNSLVSKAFQNIRDNKSLSAIALMTEVNNFFTTIQKYKDCGKYKDCTFVTYMTALSYNATKGKKLLKKTSLCSLIKEIGVKCPPGIDDIDISVVAFKLSNEGLTAWVEISLEKLAKSHEVFKNLHSVVKKKSLLFKVRVDLLLNLSIICPLAKLIEIPTVGDHSLKIYNPRLSLNFSPIFKFIVVELEGDLKKTKLKSSIFSNENTQIKISLVIDNLQMAGNLDITGCSLVSPLPLLKGLHFDEFGVQIGWFFEEGIFEFGIQGKFHIGDKKPVPLKDDRFGIVLGFEDELIVPLYLSFYIERLDLNTVIEIFTNSSPHIPFPVSLSNLSYYWAPEPVVLPDGTLADMGAGFSATLDIARFVFYAKFKLDLEHGISGLAEMSPVHLGNELKITGDGKGIFLKVDNKGNPIKNNQKTQNLLKIDNKGKLKKGLPKTSVSKVKTIVPPGGPVLIISTSSSPYFHVDVKASLFDFFNEEVSATINNKEASFLLDYETGIKLFSIKMIDSFVRLKVTFGFGNYELDMLGVAGLIVPPQDSGLHISPLAKAAVIFKANFIPDEGFLGISAQLTSDSFILSKNCHLTGGIAFYCWFSGEHAGDFVQTIGGYNPNFNLPTRYPRIPRVGFNWRVDKHISIKGDGYYALCSHALMAGGCLEAVWHSGHLKAWFIIGADFLIAWKPYHYDIDLYVDFGVSFTFHFFGTHHIHVHIGADLSLWGPDFSGKAHIHLWIVSFTIRFGAHDSQKPKPIDWDNFKTSFLPADDKVCNISVKEGLVTTQNQNGAEPNKLLTTQNQDGAEPNQSNHLGVINPKDFSLIINSVIPSKEADSGGEKIPTQGNNSFGIGSMGLTSNDLHTKKTITITKSGDPDFNSNDYFQYAPILKNVPVGLWGESLTPKLNGKRMINQALAGFEIKPKNPPTPGETQAINISELKYTTIPVDKAYNFEIFLAFQSDNLDGQQKRDKIKNTIVSTQPAREQLLKELGFTCGDLTPSVANQFLIAPQIGQLIN